MHCTGRNPTRSTQLRRDVVGEGVALRAFGRSGAFGARWHFDWHAIVSSRAVQSRASARSQALDATCVSRKNYVVRGDASFCTERKIPINIAQVLRTKVYQRHMLRKEMRKIWAAHQPRF